MAEQDNTTVNDDRLKGILPVFHTPYHSDESIDYATLERQIHWLIDEGADGVVMAMASETLRLGSEEREQLAVATCRFAEGRATAVISVGAESSYLAERYARHAESVGATALMAIPPVSIAVSEDELRRYYGRILKATSLPVVVQDASGYVGIPMSITVQASLFQEWGERVMFKPEAVPIGRRLSQLRDATNGRAQIFEGTGGTSLVDSYRRGIAGTMPGADLIKIIVALWRALENGDENRIYNLSLPLSALVSLCTGLDGFLAIEKYLLMKQGIFKNTVTRGPVAFELEQETRNEVDRLFDRCQQAL